MTIRRLNPTDTITYRNLRLRALRDAPTAFASSYAEERKWPLTRFEARLILAAHSWAFGCFIDEKLVGLTSLVRETRLKLRHKAGIYGVFVDPHHRRNGLGRMLLNRAIAQAHRMRGLQQLNLGVNEANVSARKLYESAGFTVYAREVGALCVNGQFQNELWMTLSLDRDT